MKVSINILLMILLFSTCSFVYDINDLITDARAHYAKYQTEFNDLTVKFEGTFTMGEAKDSKITSTHYMKGNKFRNEGQMNMAGMAKEEDMPAMPGGNLDFVILFDGTDYWTLTMGMKMKLPKDQMPGNAGSTPSYWEEPIEGSTIAGDETVNGRDCWVVLSPQSEDEDKTGATKTWIDKKHFIFVRNEVKTSDDVLTTDFSDFRTVDGDFVVPYHYTVTSDHSVAMTGGITDLQTNSGLADDLFDPEQLGGGAGMDLQNLDIDALMKQAEELKKKFGGNEAEGAE